MIGRNDDCWCKSGKKWKKCHFPHLPPENSSLKSSEVNFKEVAKRYYKEWGIILKNKEQIEGCRAAGHLAAAILDEVCLLAKPGVTTNELNAYAHKRIIESGAIPAPLGYGRPPYPKSICTSLNDVICHGIPNDIPLQIGDIMNVDVSLYVNGYCGDCGKMVAVGGVTTEERKRVFDSSLLCLKESIERAVRPGSLLSQVGAVIQEIANSKKTTVVTDFVGHGIGTKMHEAPQVFHFRNNLHIPLVPGMLFTIEPMINAGVKDPVIDSRDGWTARTKDGKASAQWEHMVLVTDEGCEILTPWTETACEIM